MPLTDLKIRKLKPAAKNFKISDGEGLHVLVTPAGSKLWRLAYRFGGKQKQLSMGSYPDVSLLDARRLRDEAKRKLASGIDPAPKKEAKGVGQKDSGETFAAVAERWFEKNREDWVPAYAMRLRNRMSGDIYPALGDRPIADITPKEVLDALRKIEERGAIDMARRVYQMIGKVFRFAVAENVIPSDPSRDIADALAPRKQVAHRNSIPPAELPALIKRMRGEHGDIISSLGTIFTIHTMVRTNETRFAQWHEFENLDGDNPLWRIGAERMKMRRDHIVPLTSQSLGLIERIREINGHSQWVFKTPGKKNQPISQNAMLYFLYRLGYSGRSTIHGMRSSASTWLNENEFNRDWIELQLAHVDDSVRGIYNSALYLRQRRDMLIAWSNFLEPDDEFDDLL